MQELIVLFCTLIAAGHSLPQSILSLRGSWVMKTDNAKIYEHWMAVGDSVLIGSSYRVTEYGDSILLERLTIKYINDTLCYIPTLVDQEDYKPVVFKLSLINNKQVVFENPLHDFPQRIEYQWVGTHEMQAFVSGTFQGQASILKYHYKRIR